jgi:hypothetical protein
MQASKLPAISVFFFLLHGCGGPQGSARAPSALEPAPKTQVPGNGSKAGAPVDAAQPKPVASARHCTTANIAPSLTITRAVEGDPRPDDLAVTLEGRRFSSAQDKWLSRADVQEIRENEADIVVKVTAEATPRIAHWSGAAIQSEIRVALVLRVDGGESVATEVRERISDGVLRVPSAGKLFDRFCLQSE